MKSLIWKTLLALALLALPAFADDAVLDRGFKAGAQYDFHGIDSVNALNGNLAVRIPLGQTYRTNGTLSYQFSLAYNSSLWDWLTFGYQNGSISVREMVYSNQFISNQDASPGFQGSESFPARSANSGLGWTVSLGELQETFENVRYKYQYVSEDGAGHAFYDQLHANTTSGDTPDLQTLYTRDASYIRMVAIERSGGANSQVQLYEVQLPDGMHKRYRRVAWPADHSLNHRWLLESISDPFGNALWVQRSAVPAVGSQWVWTYREGTVGADHYVNYPSEVPTNIVRTHTLTYRLQRFYDLRIEQIDLAASSGPATFSFGYDDAYIARASGNTWGDAQTLYVPFDSNHGYRVAVSLLRSVTLPSSGGSWKFSYITDTGDELPVSWPSDQTDPHFTYPVSTREGHLARIDYPTGGGVSYDYGSGGVPARACGAAHLGAASLPVVGVVKRQQWKSTSVADGDPWLYFRSTPLDTLTTNPCHLPRELLSATIDPYGRTDLAFYSIYVYNADNPQSQQWDSHEWGLGFTRYDKDSGGRFLSSQVFQCNAGTFSSAGTNLGTVMKNMLPRYAHNMLGSSDWSGTTCGAPLRSHYVQYETPAVVDCPPDGESPCWQPNQRMLSDRTVYHDDLTGPVAPDVVTDHRDAGGNSTFDGLGHYRRSQLTSHNFTFDVLRTETQNWNPNRSVVNVPGANEPWMLETYNKTQVDEAGDSRVTLFDFAPDSGFLRAKRVYASGAGESANDVITTYQRTQRAGVVLVDTMSFGGDVSNVVANTGTVTQQSPEYWTQTSMQYGSVSQRSILCPPGRTACATGAVILTPEANTVDPNDGKVTASSEASGLTTSYTWDGLGRITRLAPMQGAPTTYVYSPFTSSSNPSKVTVTQSQGNTTYAYAEYRYDHFGRLASEKHQFPAANGHKMNVKVWSYRPTGELERESTTRLDDAMAEPEVDRRFDQFDVFGRAQLILPPDGGAGGKHTLLTYFGVQAVKERVFNVATTLGAASGDVVSWKTSDALGRLRRVEETSLAGSPHTDYTYDPAGTLKLVDMGEQKRWFTYDGRGLLKDETDPELNGVPMHYQYDSRGHMTALRHGPGSTPSNVKYVWDAAERLVSVAPLAMPTNVLKEYVYYDSNNDCEGSAGFAWGKVRTAIGHNYLLDPSVPAGGTPARVDVPVQQQFRYLGIDGRVSEVKTLVAGTEKFHTGYAYDAQGNVTQIDYPLCSNCGADNGAPRLVSPYYDLGALSGVNGFADGITYLPNGLMGHLRHANNVEDVTVNDDTGLPRPKTLLQKNNGFITWKAGDYEYDAAGNIFKIGGDAYAYDGSGRLTASRVGTGSGGSGGVSQTFAYDRYGNIRFDGADATIDANNRIIGVSYDDGGNIRQLDGYTYEFDALNRMTTMMGGGQAVAKEFVYDASDERLAVWDLRYGAAPGRLRQLWSFRDAGGHVLRDFEKLDGAWHSLKDYVYRGSALLASVTADGALRHFTLDHLGTPRVATDGSGTLKSTHLYAPFGAELTTSTDGERMKFTGHERDENDPLAGTQAGDLDYMHARYYSPVWGRFVSIDPVLGTAADPQSWNRFAYVANNPVSRTDPTGRATVTIPPPPPATVSQWTAEQMLQENWKNIQKVLMAERGELVRGASERAAGLRQAVVRLMGTLEEGVDVDHQKEVGLFRNALNAFKNLNFLDSSVNRSNGVRLMRALANIKEGTTITKVEFTALGNEIENLAQSVGSGYVEGARTVAGASEALMGEVESAAPALAPLLESLPPL